jgi:hypothetical protein
MSNIFISYSSEDRDWARRLAQALEQEGWSVWWDRKIAVGKTYQRVIEAQLDAAECVIVIWSGHSVASDWVVAEAAEGRERDLLVPVAIDDAKPPLIFRQIQTADLRQWDGSPAAPVFRRLADDIRPLVAASKKKPTPASAAPYEDPAPAPPAPPGSTGRKYFKWYALAAAILTAVGLLAAWPYMKPTFFPAPPPLPAAEIIEFTADPEQIEAGGSTQLSWRTANARRVTLGTAEDAPGESIEPAGSQIVQPRTTATFFLKAQGADPEKKSAVARLTVTVAPPANQPHPQIVVYEADRRVLVRGESTALHWETAHASRIELGDAVVKPSGDVEIRPDQTTAYRLVAANESGQSDSASITITVEELPRGEIVEIQELLVRLGFDVGTADGLPGSRTRSAIEAFQNETGLSPTGLPSRDLAQKLREAHESAPTPQIIVFKSERPKIRRGETLTLWWETANAAAVTLNPLGTVEAAGERRVRPAETTRYELVATNRVGRSVREFLTVRVDAPLEIGSLTVDRPLIGPEDKTTIRWRTSGAERVELIPFGEVGPSGSQTVSPNKTTTYELVATGADGAKINRAVTITVDAPTVSVVTVILAGGGKYFDDKRVIYSIFSGVPLAGMAAKRLGKVHTIFEFPLGKYKTDAAKYSYDINRSKKLMAEAGLVKGLGVYLFFTEDLADLAGDVQNYLARIGIQVKSKAFSPDAARRAAESQIVKTGRPTLLLESIK